MDLSFQNKEKEESQKECAGGAHQTLLWGRMPFQANMHIVTLTDVNTEQNSAAIKSQS